MFNGLGTGAFVDTPGIGANVGFTPGANVGFTPGANVGFTPGAGVTFGAGVGAMNWQYGF